MALFSVPPDCTAINLNSGSFIPVDGVVDIPDEYAALAAQYPDLTPLALAENVERLGGTVGGTEPPPEP